MEIIYTEITGDLEAELLEIAKQALSRDKKVYYIVPSSLSFEKEKKLIKELYQANYTAVFDFVVTRFKRLPYYFDPSIKSESGVELSRSGLSMLFRKVLNAFDPSDIPRFASLSSSTGFLDLLVDLRTELIEADLTPEDLPASEKNEELKRILKAFEQALSTSYSNVNHFRDFIAAVSADKLTEALQQSTFIIAGYTRFTVEEENFIRALNEKKSDIYLGTYLSDSDLSADGTSVYQLSQEMISKFGIKPVKGRLTASVHQVYSKLTALIEQDAHFTLSNAHDLSRSDSSAFEIWEVENQKVEIEKVAKSIKQHIAIHSDSRYRDFTVLVGNVEDYALLVRDIFDLYEIPYFYSQEEAMRHHPLIIFLESLQAIVKKNFQAADVLNFLKSKLYLGLLLDQEVLDQFEYVVLQKKLRGKKQFSNDLSGLSAKLNHFREKFLGVASPLQVFLSKSQHVQTGKKWLTDFVLFLEAAQLPKVLSSWCVEAQKKGELLLADRHEQVFQTLTKTLTEFEAVFSADKLSLTEFLEIFLAGVQHAAYRQVPAAADSVMVKDFELVEPRTNKYVYAVGLSQSNFPRVKINATLLSDNERAQINAASADGKVIEELSQISFSKNLLTTLSLVNSATEKLILSTPQIAGNEQDALSSVLKLFLEHSEGYEEKHPDRACIHQYVTSLKLSDSLAAMANSRAVVAEIGEIERQLAQTEELRASQSSIFWGSIFRLLSKNDKKFSQLITHLDQDIAPVKLDSFTVNQLYSKGLNASVTSFQNFYRCQYRYFLEKTLSIGPTETNEVTPAKIGTYYHKVFQLLMGLSALHFLTADNFEEQLETVFSQVDQLPEGRVFRGDAHAAFILSLLKNTARQTATLLKKVVTSDNIQPLLEEEKFGAIGDSLKNFPEDYDAIQLYGTIDRTDKFFDSDVAIVDYKSGPQKFNLRDVADGSNLQLLTYLDILQKNNPKTNLWGALYLRIQNEIISLNAVNSESEVGKKIATNSRYAGLVVGEAKNLDFIKVSKGSKVYASDRYTPAELETLLTYNREKFIKAGQTLRAGEVAINPLYTKNRAVACQHCPFKSICRFEADRHLAIGFGRSMTTDQTARIRADILGRNTCEKKETDHV